MSEREQTYDYLVHHGILGMKWGVRRYQNKDGSLTAEGRKRYLNDDGTYNETAKKEIPLTAQTNAELQQTVTRMNLERQYRQLSEEERKRNESRVAKVLLDFAEKAAGKVFDTALNAMLNKAKGGNDDDDKKKSLSDYSKDELSHPENFSEEEMKEIAKMVANAKIIKNYGDSMPDPPVKKRNKKKDPGYSPSDPTGFDFKS